MGSRLQTVAGPKLFGRHLPVTNTKTLVVWRGRNWEAHIADRGWGWGWEIWFDGEVLGRAYSSRNSAKMGLEKEVRRLAKLAKSVMGVV